jgi:hypothetical protein
MHETEFADGKFWPREQGRLAALVIVFMLATAFSQAFAQTQYSIGYPTGEQQYMLELINRARADGGAEATRLGLSGLQEGPPSINGEPWTIQNSVQPLSWNPLLFNCAQGHAKNLNNADQFFLGGSPHTFGGMTPSQRIAAAGYSMANYNGPTTPSGFFPGPENIFEAEAQGSGPFVGANLIAGILQGHNGLFTDQSVPGRGHRNTTMLPFFREIGIGITSGRDNENAPGQPNGQWDSLYVVQNFGTQTNSLPFITGVAYQDTNGNGFYDPGEGIGNLRADVTGSNNFAVTSPSGGYSVPVPGNGSYTVTFSGGSFPATQRSATVSNSLNTKVNLVAAVSTAPTVLANISTRLRVETGENVLIGGFIVTGTQPKRVMVRAIGPSLPLVGKLANPTLELRDGTGALIRSNDDWRVGGQEAEIIGTTIPPSNDLESAIVANLPANNASYTAIVRGANNGTGIGVVEAYDLDRSVDSKLANISTRGLVSSGDNVLIAGTIVLGQTSQKVIVRAIGPSLNVTGKLADPILELRDANGGLVKSNDNWRSDQEVELIASAIPPANDLEAALVTTLSGNAANYTAIVRGAGGATGIAVVEVYAVN